MNGCEYYQELISQLIDGELTKDEEAVLADHLQTCPECRAMYEAFRELSSVMAEDMEEAPESLCINVMAELRRAEMMKKNRRKSAIKAVMATAACAVLVFAAGRLTGVSGGDSAANMSAVYDVKVVAEEEIFAVPKDMPMEASNDSAELADAGVSMLMEPAAPAPEAMMEDNSETLTASFSLRQAVTMDTAAEAAEPQDWLRLSDELNGLPVENEVQLPDSPALSMTVFHEGVYYTVAFYQLENSICYFDPLDGMLKESLIALEELAN